LPPPTDKLPAPHAPTRIGLRGSWTLETWSSRNGLPCCSCCGVRQPTHCRPRTLLRVSGFLFVDLDLSVCRHAPPLGTLPLGLLVVIDLGLRATMHRRWDLCLWVVCTAMVASSFLILDSSSSCSRSLRRNLPSPFVMVDSRLVATWSACLVACHELFAAFVRAYASCWSCRSRCALALRSVVDNQPVP